MEQISSVKTNSTNGYKITFKKIARAAAAEVRVHKKLAIITFVLYGVAFLLFAFNGYVFGRPDKVIPGDIDTYGTFEPSGWGTAFAVGGIIVSFFTALNVFRDANNQQLCDVAMALPIKAVERFFSKLLCLFYIQTAPLIVSVLGGNAIAILFGSIQFDGFLRPDVSTTLFLMTVGMLAMSLYTMSIVTLCACCCGAVAESAYFSIILMFITNALPIAFVDNIMARTSGFSHNYILFSSNNMGINVKFWGFLSLFGGDEEQVLFQCGISCLISLAVMFSAIFIYKKRDARTVGKPIASRVFFEIIMAASCFTVFMLGAMSEGAMWGVLIAAVAYVIVNIIVTRAKINFKSFLIWSGKFLATLAAFTVLMVATVKTGAFGFYKTRPETKYLEDAVFTVNIYDYSNDYFHVYNKELCSGVLTAEQADEVMKICQKHISHGIMNVNPLNVIFDQRTSVVCVDANSDKYYTPCPRPSFQFDNHYDSSHFIRYNDAFSLNYSQRIRVSPKDAAALLKELKDSGLFDDVLNDDAYDDSAYPETALPV